MWKKARDYSLIFKHMNQDRQLIFTISIMCLSIYSVIKKYTFNVHNVPGTMVGTAYHKAQPFLNTALTHTHTQFGANIPFYDTVHFSHCT